MSMGWGAFNKAKGEGGGNFKAGRRFVLKDGESVDVRFLVNENEPYIFKEHYIANVRRYLICAEDASREGKHTGCVPCFLARTDSKRYKNAARKFSFSVIDSRKYHVIEGDKKEYKPCTDDESCKLCRKGNEAKASGIRYWSVPQSLADQIRTFEKESLGKACSCGGRIKVKEYVCPECDEELEPDDPSEASRCFNCEKSRGKKKPFMVQPEEILVCNKGCKSPKRVSLSDAWVTVSRSGEGTQSTYNFAVSEVAPLTKEYADSKPVEFSGHPDFQPIASAEQAAICNVNNPFGGERARPPRPDEDKDEEDEDSELEFAESAKVKRY